MKHRHNNRALFLTLVFLTAVLLLLGQACDPAFPLQIENQTDMALSIYVQEHEVGNVEPTKSAKLEGVIPGTLSYCLVEAKNSKGEVIYSRKFSLPELNDADWKVVIPPLQEGPLSSDNITLNK